MRSGALVAQAETSNIIVGEAHPELPRLSRRHGVANTELRTNQQATVIRSGALVAQTEMSDIICRPRY